MEEEGKRVPRAFASRSEGRTGPLCCCKRKNKSCRAPAWQTGGRGTKKSNKVWQQTRCRGGPRSTGRSQKSAQDNDRTQVLSAVFAAFLFLSPSLNLSISPRTSLAPVGWILVFSNLSFIPAFLSLSLSLCRPSPTFSILLCAYWTFVQRDTGPLSGPTSLCLSVSIRSIIRHFCGGNTLFGQKADSTLCEETRGGFLTIETGSKGNEPGNRLVYWLQIYRGLRVGLWVYLSSA